MGAATQRQRGKVHAMLGQLGVTERDQRLATLTAVLYRPVKSTNDLSFDDARVVIDTLGSIADRDDAGEYLSRFVAEASERMAGAS